MRWQDRYKDKLISAEKAATLIKSGDRVVAPIYAEGKNVLHALAKRKDELENVTFWGTWDVEYPWMLENMEPHFNIKDCFTLRISRKGIAERWIDWVPHIFGLTDGRRYAECKDRGPSVTHADVFVGTVAPPDSHGYCSFGLTVYWAPAMFRTAKLKICEIQPNYVWTNGVHLHLSEVDYLVEAPPEELAGAHGPRPMVPEDEAHASQVIGANIASLVRDGDTVQVGTGTTSGAAIAFLNTRNDLGIDTEIILPDTVELIRAGNITAKYNNVNPGKLMLTALLTRKDDPRTPDCRAFVDHNPLFEFNDVGWLCNVPRIAANDHMTSIGACVAVDLLGQAVLTHLPGGLPISGAGGGVEYCIGSHYSRGGRSILGLLTTARGGTVSRIVPQLLPGQVVMIPPVYVDYLVTEYGIVNLEGRSNRERADAIISIAHPNFRAELREEARKLFWP